MTEDLFSEKLNWFKQNEKPEVVLVIADNPELVKIVIAWTNLEVKRSEELSKPVGDSENATWEWLWNNARFSLTELKTKSGVACSETILDSKLRLLNGNRILYADGTINSFVQRYLREQVLKLFEAKPKKRNPKSG